MTARPVGKPREVRWVLRENPKLKFSAIDLGLLYISVLDVVTFTARGLNGELRFRGILHEEANGVVGIVRWRTDEVGRPKRGGKWEVLAPTKKKKIPKLIKDPIFTNEVLAAQGAIHLNYRPLKDKDEHERVPMTIVHEATHKFARTTDVDNPHSYSVRNCRKMNWTLAVRNATHHERFMATDWSAILKGTAQPQEYIGLEEFKRIESAMG